MDAVDGVAEGREQLALVNARILVPDAGGVALVASAASALLIVEGEIAAIGSGEDVRSQAGSGAAVKDLRGATVSPGFVDAHVHAFACALDSLTLSCLPPSVDSLGVIQQRVAERADSTPPGGWIVGTGYDDARLREHRHPSRHDLDQAAPRNPVVLTRVCGHMSVASTRALELAGIDDATPDPSGGSIVRDPAGHATGLLLERAQELVSDIVPPADDDTIASALVRTRGELLARGITTIGEALLGSFHPRETALWRDAFADGWIGPTVLFLAAPGLLETEDVSDLPVIGTKLFADGVVTGRTAFVTEPFEGSVEHGMLIHEPRELADLVGRSIARGLPVGIHAMGDAGIDTAIGAIARAEEIVGRHPPLTRRHRIEHCTLPSREARAVMRSGGIVPVTQPVFLFAEGEAYLAAFGPERCRRAYPLRTMRREGLSPALSSDAPATSWGDPLDPWLGVATAVTRRTWGGSVLGEGEAVTVAEALGMYTLEGAKALGVEERTGSIQAGKDADLLVFPDDPVALPPERLPGMRPTAVLRRGHVAHGTLD